MIAGTTPVAELRERELSRYTAMMATKDGTMQTREFVFYAEELAMRSLPPAVPPPERKVMWTVLQLYYGDPNVHFEVQPQMSRQQIELGLHFEGPAETNDAWAAELAARAPEFMAALGDEWELEEWTASWRRLHRVIRFQRLDADLGEQVAAELVKALIVLGPFVREGTSPPRPLSTGGERGSTAGGRAPSVTRASAS